MDLLADDSSVILHSMLLIQQEVLHGQYSHIQLQCSHIQLQYLYEFMFSLVGIEFKVPSWPGSEFTLDLVEQISENFLSMYSPHVLVRWKPPNP